MTMNITILINLHIALTINMVKYHTSGYRCSIYILHTLYIVVLIFLRNELTMMSL